MKQTGLDAAALFSGESVFAFGTKAETLLRLKPRLVGAQIPESCHFSAGQWLAQRDEMLNAIQQQFESVLLAVRSSALVEDGAKSSNAGAFLSRLKVRCSDRDELAAAIDNVVASMTGHPRDQVLVQSMAEDIALSGVIMTFDMVHGAPYYCIEYELSLIHI